ncbi:transcriptional activator RfaH [Vibrio nigripulchritudo ATCC 27043]|uniref:Transcription antitermination protein RfaH n=1 Tax=Vibrio nigripulchritudo SOn1 TaxID=1238450 RepID=A0AAV2VP35_9VIBR|nr:transcription/translation regulatory transformer protein RfaH [Vibrio nigripulchritudo]EGU60579.1 transcriptional activator RfaH [Vibrio nigripulchritudo ATCC 27043]CCN72001.1 Transcriptional activator rfaH [Vibrio nigripulchritudo SFn118]CCO46473.1 Transcriptional activator rfaH [Vibrio nigripulchritudo SOn1]
MKRWYLLYCKRGEQARAKLNLENQGVECYYPEVEVEKVLRNKKQTVKEPLFPCYVFIRFDYEAGPSFTTVRSTRGVVDFIRCGAHPHELQGDLIYELKLLEKEDETVIKMSEPEKGQTVQIEEGQFAGITAIYQEPDGDKRSFLLVEMINKPVKVSVDNSSLSWE